MENWGATKFLDKHYSIDSMSWRHERKIYLQRSKACCVMMITWHNVLWFNDNSFDKKVFIFFEVFKDIKGVDAYFFLGWTNENVPWRPLWPSFDGWFVYGGLETTNRVKHHWEIKYTILGGKINHSI
jgi:hypothetical protein